MNLEVEV